MDMLLELRRLPRSDKRDAERDYTGSSIFSRRRFALGFQSRGVCSFVWANSHNRYFYLVVGLLAPIPAPPLHPRGQLSRPSAGRGNLAWDPPSRYIGARAPRRRAFEACAMDDFYKDALRFGCLQVRPSCVPFVSAPAAGRSAGAASASSPSLTSRLFAREPRLRARRDSSISPCTSAVARSFSSRSITATIPDRSRRTTRSRTGTGAHRGASPAPTTPPLPLEIRAVPPLRPSVNDDADRLIAQGL